ncbi:PLP-dependent aminotransferase family protein [Luteibacter aegosomatis]|uniref:aminotransferase-like domain-containing protein n=1 Tax=Luteibacter aegosomatis TaxID=2911537 RepID=UPI001FF81FD4|nr:PLP-dependent aminotransferase family protein [Luteibacter aegosomatis]UPG87287.1 PLP-dependent aminotransferase family protein [Luteibacter aegosomatis]
MATRYDLAVNLPLRSLVATRLRQALAHAPVDERMLAYPWPGGDPWLLDAIAGWMARHGGHEHVDGRRLVLTLGARHALVLALSTCCSRGDALLVESPTYHGFRAAAEARGVRTIDVAMDKDGLRPDALDEAARTSGARTLYVQPTLHNPTTRTMPAGRRREIAEVAVTRDLTVIEGDVYSPLRPGVGQPLSALLPDRCLHAGGIGKVLGPGLRIGWLLLPDEERRDAVATVIARDTDGLPALLPEVVGHWLADGTADALLDELRLRLRERNALAAAILDARLVTADALHAWLPLEDADAAAARIRQAGVDITVANGGIRLSLAAEEDPARLEAALLVLKNSLR